MATHLARNFRPAVPLPDGILGQNAPATTASAGAEKPQTQKILLVEPDETRRQHLRVMLGPREKDLIEANSTSEAVTAISVEHVHLVLVNLRAPELGGTELCRLLKRADSTHFLPVFVLAARSNVEAEVSAIEAGADCFLSDPINARILRARVDATLQHKAMIDSLDGSETALFSLAQSVEERDPELGQHCARLAFMASGMGLALGLPPHDILALQRGGYLHDIGKIAIPDSVLFKAGPLTPEEWEVMRTHTERGERICSKMRSLASVLPIIRHHHERWDGSGYPDGLAGERIPLLARILQMADIYDALTTARPYKRAMTPEEALTAMREEMKKGWRDPKLMELFADLLPMFRVPTVTDFSQYSLQALSASLERFRKEPVRIGSRSSIGNLPKPSQIAG
jgi:putative two-component system response regulator